MRKLLMHDAQAHFYVLNAALIIAIPVQNAIIAVWKTFVLPKGNEDDQK
jgi:hypothetical protein